MAFNISECFFIVVGGCGQVTMACSLRLKIHLMLLLSIFTFPLSLAHSQLNNASSDQHALLSFKQSITSDPYNSLLNWNATFHFCNWTGVACSFDLSRVVQLYLPSKGLEGSLSPLLGNLSSLTELHLGNNTLRGVIPPDLGRLSNLRLLYLSRNELEGIIPPTLGRCLRLQFLSLSYNNLIGSIPPDIGLLPDLRVLYLGANKLTGAIPSSLSNLSALVELDLYENHLQGIIPPSLANISTLEFLQISGPNLSGTIPSQLGRLTRLRKLIISGTQITGEIPASLSNCTTLQYLALYDSKLWGEIPRELGHNLANLEKLFLSGNRLSGSIPSSLGNCSKLTTIELTDNRLSGTLPLKFSELVLLDWLSLDYNRLIGGGIHPSPLTTLANCSRLRRLDLSYNQLTGSLPLSIDRLSTNLYDLDLSNNNIGGNIPQQIGTLTNLTELDLSNNLFNGSIPSAIGNLRNLEQLFLGGNKLQGNIPPEIGRVTQRLGLLALDYNLLDGQIPETIGKLQFLRKLYLNNNHLSGEIPVSIGQCKELEVVDLSYNRLNGSIPPQVAGLPNLQIYFNLSSNLLQGKLPSLISKMVMVQAIDISGNMLSGEIPASLGSCAGLQYLNLSRNALHGQIPTSFGDLKSLERMDLSHNNLSGIIPIMSLQKLKLFRFLNLSFNNLSGEVPNSGIFKNLTSSSFMGNPGLCSASWLLYSPACLIPMGRAHSPLKRILIAVGTICAFIVLCCLLVGFLWKRRSSHGNPKASAQLKFDVHPRISYEELNSATNGFNESNLLGFGSFGSVYKATFGDSNIAAVKVLNLQNEEAHDSFTRECKIMQTVRHRNLVKIITSCSNHEFKALVLEFMSNGSLEKRLHSGADECGLNLKDRLNIAIDIAHAVEYLHHDCFLQIVHCDLKPNNILLDDNMTAHVTDFGIARIRCANSTDSVTSTLALAGTIGYIPPEYGLSGCVSPKGDVYSYGILLLEMITRKKPDSHMFEHGLNLHKWVSMAYPDRVEEVIDSKLLAGAVNETWDCLVQLLRVGLLCTTECPADRLSMRDIVALLERIRRIFEGPNCSPPYPLS